MKTRISIALLSVLFFVGCGSDDINPVQDEVFIPVTISLSGLNIELEDTSFRVQDYTFKAFRALSYTPDTGGILLAFPLDGSSSYIELDLSDLKDVSKITSNVSDYGGSTKVSLWKAGQIINEIDVPGGVRDFDLVIDIDINEIDALRFTSFEGDVRTITLE